MSQKTTTRRMALAALAAASLTVPAAAEAAAPDPIFAAIEKHRTAFTAMNVANGSPLCDEDMQQYYDAENDALSEFSRTVPTTQPGLAAMLIYAAEIVSDNRPVEKSMPYPFADDAPLLETLATAARALLRA